MIQALCIENFGTIAKCELSLQSGMIALSGESGAGKSLITEAILLLAGARADTRKVGPWAKQANISGLFAIEPNTLPYQALTALDLLNSENPRQCLIRRVIAEKSQGNKIYINDQLITAQTLNEIGQTLIGSHGQHAHLALLKPSVQLQALDRYGACQSDAKALKDKVRHWQQTDNEYRALREKITANEQARALINYQLQELEALNLTEDGYGNLNQAHWDLSQGENRQRLAHEALGELSENEHSIIGRIDRLSQRIQNDAPNDERFVESLEHLVEARTFLQESSHSLKTLSEQIDLDPQALAELDQQLETWHDMARKHCVEPQDLYQHQQSLLAGQQQESQDSERLKALEDECKAALKEANDNATRLSQARQGAAEALSDAMSKGLHQLGMADAELTVTLSEKVLSLDGIDQIQFLVQTNLGHKKGPLAEVASGGELARISLALLVLNGQRCPTPTVIFDEVDTGTSGAIAAKIGQLLQQLGQDAQVISISHLPQIAACASTHVLVKKTTQQGQTQTHTKVLTDTQRESEIARLLGGSAKVKASAYANAKALLAEHQE